MPGRRSREAGQTLAEFALVLLVFLLLVMGIVDFSRAVYARSVVASAAREGARYGVIHPDDTNGITMAAKGLVVGISTHESVFKVQVTRPDEEYVRVDVSYRYQPVSLLIARYVDGGSGAGLWLRARSTMRVE